MAIHTPAEGIAGHTPREGVDFGADPAVTVDDVGFDADLDGANPDKYGVKVEERRERDGTKPDITYVLAAMRLATGADPVPGRVTADALAAFSLRLPGSVVAAPTDVMAASGARSGGQAQRHRFVTGDQAIDVEVGHSNGRLEIAGQLSPDPSPGAWVEVRTPHISKIRVPSADGHFAVTGLPPGWFSVVYHRPENPPIATRWLRARV